MGGKIPESRMGTQNVEKERKCFKAGNAVSRLKQRVWRPARMETGTETEKSRGRLARQERKSKSCSWKGSERW